jgi:hypothetical protein
MAEPSQKKKRQIAKENSSDEDNPKEFAYELWRNFFTSVAEVVAIFVAEWTILGMINDEASALNPLLEKFLQVTETDFQKKMLPKVMKVILSWMTSDKHLNRALILLEKLFEQLPASFFNSGHSEKILPLSEVISVMGQTSKTEISKRLFFEVFFPILYQSKPKVMLFFLCCYFVFFDLLTGWKRTLRMIGSYKSFQEWRNLCVR